MYYIKNATSEASRHKYHVYLEGGGWCTGTASCVRRALTVLGSSSPKYHNKTVAAECLVQQVVDAATPSKGTRDAFATATATAGRVLVAASGNIMEHFAVEVAVGVAKGAVSLATG